MRIEVLRQSPERRQPRWRMMLTLGVVLAAIALSLWYFSPAGQQSRALREARRHIDSSLSAAVSADDRFRRVELGTYTGEGGAIAVKGEVASWEDARALRETVAATRPPCAVYWGFLFVKESQEHEPPDPALTRRVTLPDP